MIVAFPRYGNILCVLLSFNVIKTGALKGLCSVFVAFPGYRNILYVQLAFNVIK